MEPEIPIVKEIVINEQVIRYVGKPFSVHVYHESKRGDGDWGGSGNILSPGEEPHEVRLIDLESCFSLLKYWTQNSSDLTYVRGFALDYVNQTVYYDDDLALSHALKLELINIGKHFTKYEKRNFAE